MKSNYSRIMGFTPIAPTPDTDELSETGPRLMLLIGKDARSGISQGNETGDNTLAVVPRGTLSAGWVIGVSPYPQAFPSSLFPLAHPVTLRNTMKTPSIAMSDFFALPEVKAAQEVQKRNPYGSDAHRKAHDTIRALADQYGAAGFIGEY